MTRSPADRVGEPAERIVLVGGHESRDGADLASLITADRSMVAAGTGRGLTQSVESALDAGESVTVLPMTFGRDPVLVAETAKALHWIRKRRTGRILLAPQFGTTDHLIALLRGAGIRLQRQRPGAALVIAADASDNFNDAELHRVAHLVRADSSVPEVTVALLRPGRDTLGDIADRLSRLGHTVSGVAPAGFAAATELPAADGHAMTWCGPLMRDNAVRRVIAERVMAAHHAHRHGDDGIAAALGADHEHGYAHSHDDVAGHGHGHGHSHPTPAGKDRHGLSQTAV